MKLVTMSTIAFILISPALSLGQNTQTLPDYSNWDRVTFNFPVVIDGSNTEVMASLYSHDDYKTGDNNWNHHEVVEIKDEQGNPWLTLYFRREMREMGHTPVEAQGTIYLLENNNGLHSLVKEVSYDMFIGPIYKPENYFLAEQDIESVLADKYKLEYRIRGPF